MPVGSSLRIGVLTAGGDAPGLNAAIRAVVRRAAQFRHQVIGVHNGWQGLFDRDVEELPVSSVSGVLGVGGSILGTTRFNPMVHEKGLERIQQSIVAERLDGLVVVGGRDSLTVGLRLWETGVPVVGVPKTINNDVCGTDCSIGFHTAATTVADALDKLATTAAAHSRVICVEVMGRETGWIALHGGLAGGAGYIMGPEVPTTIAETCERLTRRANEGQHFSVVVVSEGARITDLPDEGELAPYDEFGNVRLDRRGLGERVAKAIEQCTGMESRTVVLGHLQRGGRPTVFDRVLATRMGVFAVDLIREGRFGLLVGLSGNRMEAAPLSEVERGSYYADKELYKLAEVFY